MGLKGKQFDKIKFALIQRSIYAKPMYMNDGQHIRSLLSLPASSAVDANAYADDILSEVARLPDDFLGLDHVNRNRGMGGKGDSIFIR